MGKLRIFLFFLTLKLLSVFVVKTSFVPDEYWQSLEVAHKLAFGYGHLTWEWTEGIRSYIYPAIIAALYKALEFFGLDSREALILTPRIFQAILSSVGDYYFWKWVSVQTDTKGNWAVVTIATSWFWFYCGSRTIINAVEMVLTVFALYSFPWSENDAKVGRAKFLLPVGLACVMRPTAFVVWLPFCIYHLARASSKSSTILKSYLPIGAFCIGLSTLVDSYFYGKLTFTPWNFFVKNVYNGIGAFYGIHGLYWYVFCGLPVILGVHFIPFLYKTWEVVKNKGPAIESVLLFDIAWTTFLFSLLSHKEFRFILPVLPMALYISCRCLSKWSGPAKNSWLWAVGAALLVGNAVPAVYFGYYHQRGTVDVMDYLAKEAHNSHPKPNFLFLMPCHSTPLYSHLHVEVPIKFLTCEPDFSSKPGYMDEADLFYLGPLTWINKAYPPNSSLPSHIVMFDVLQPHLQGFLNAHGYTPAAKFFHAHFTEGRVGENVVVLTQSA
ncbi:GPI mannosyltransferase 3 [Ischnura elegans]|uniref:GPI mannosyltransferase 3 n=1 Tax=Ischnura elegans TaxID=197161 RepID=UPI001ED8A926|nr:GPI mannosyltransferase 3 [Ischnura elegans]XP_046405379.1 GPI mannosyltransferase 3 [Ischnura elegans]